MIARGEKSGGFCGRKGGIGDVNRGALSTQILGAIDPVTIVHDLRDEEDIRGAIVDGKDQHGKEEILEDNTGQVQNIPDNPDHQKGKGNRVA